MKAVLQYVSAPDVAAKAPVHFAAHSARVAEFHQQGRLLMIGVFDDIRNDGAMGVFTTREAAEEFAAGDPFVLNGVVADWRVHDWHEILIPD